jgi:hypothetical protein
VRFRPPARAALRRRPLASAYALNHRGRGWAHLRWERSSVSPRRASEALPSRSRSMATSSCRWIRRYSSMTRVLQRSTSHVPGSRKRGTRAAHMQHDTSLVAMAYLELQGLPRLRPSPHAARHSCAPFLCSALWGARTCFAAGDTCMFARRHCSDGMCWLQCLDGDACQYCTLPSAAVAPPFQSGLFRFHLLPPPRPSSGDTGCS